MAVNDIQLKLQTFLGSLHTFSEEMQVVYLLVEIRKLIDLDQGPARLEIKNVKFYCNWTLHTSKTRDFNGFNETFESIFQDCKKGIEATNNIAEVRAKKLLNFLYLSELRKNLAITYDLHDLPKAMLEDDTIWTAFIRQLLEVLADQPIKDMPNDHLSEIRVIGANETGAAIRVYFKQPICDLNGEPHDFYQLGDGLGLN